MKSILIEFHKWTGFALASHKSCGILICGFITVITLPISVIDRLKDITGNSLTG